MEDPEPVESFEDLMLSSNDGYVPNRYAVNLKEGVDLAQLRRGEGAFFEIDEQNNDFHNSDDEDTGPYFDSEQMFQQLNHEVLGVDDDEDSVNDEENNSKTPFEKMAQGMEDLTGDGGVLKKIIRQGTGPVVPKTATVRFHSNGYKEFCDEPYDSSRFRGKPEQMRLGEGAFPGLDIGVSTMRKGELSRFLFDKEYVFKDLGCEPRVPGATVMWEVELLSFVDHGPEGDLESNFPEGERRKASFEHLMAVANGDRETGNDLYKKKLYHKAFTKYSRATKLLEECRLQNEDEENMMNQVLLKLYSNMSQCALDQNQEARCIKYARKVLFIDPKNPKAFYKMGKAFMKQGEFDKARDNLIKARRYCPGSKDIRDALVTLDNLSHRHFTLLYNTNPKKALIPIH
ncbi:predicted protein [Nematostella vectensis]|uniref:peptidylprolyl isomerase n=1 Tax=Nematostella vectensis TaxID=45351 RepID=A7RWJ0_NEMVE|nr:predicted protein [Nematostella vectensis]|eukprot:XP_001636239.1 predicted protein [Nematostella vectensis]